MIFKRKKSKSAMNIQFEYKPFDRVTIQVHESSEPAVFFQDYSIMEAGKRIDIFEAAYLHSGGDICECRCKENAIRPGHYDSDGNWLPQPGEPCYFINTDGEAIQTMVFSVTGELVTVLDRIGLYRNFYKLFGAKAVETHFFNGEDVGHDIPQSALLYPGRIKTPQ